VVTVRAFEALFAGFALLTAVLGLVRGLLVRFVPEWASPGRRRPGSLVFHLGSTLLASVAGGYLTAWIGWDNPLRDALVLGVAVLVLGALSALQARGTQPVAYQLAMVAIAPAGVLAGGLVRLRVLGLL
jgi:hypothetical protein